MRIFDFFQKLVERSRIYGFKVVGSDISRGFKSEVLKNVWVVGGIEAIVNAIQRMGTVKRDKIFDANKYITFDEIIKHIVYDLIISGNSYIRVVMNSVFQLLEPENCLLEMDNNLKIKFSYLNNEIDYDEIIHLRNVIPNETDYKRYLVGDSVLKNIYDIILLDNTILRSNLINFQNNNFILLASSKNDIVDFESIQNLAKEIESEIRRNGRINFVISPVPMDIQVVRNSDEVSYIQTMRENAIKILSVLRVPPIILGFGDSGNYVNRKEQLKMFYTNAVFPITKLIENVFRMKGIQIEFNYQNVEVLQESLIEKANVLNSLVLAGYPLKQAAQLVGLPEPEYQGQDEVSKIGSTKRLEMEVKEVNFITQDIYHRGVEVKQKFYRGHIKFSEEMRKKLLSVITTYRNYFYDEYLEKLLDAFQKGNLPEMDLLLDDFFENINHLFETSAYEWFSTILDDFKDIARLQIGTDIFSTTIVDIIAMRHAKKITRINDTVRNQIRASIAEGLSKGETTLWIADQIKNIFKAQRNRVNTIARTEITSVLNDFSHSEAYQRGMEWKIWLTAHDEVVRLSHAELDYVKVNINEPFKAGLQYPGDPGAPAEEVINCRCTLIFE